MHVSYLTYSLSIHKIIVTPVQHTVYAASLIVVFFASTAVEDSSSAALSLSCFAAIGSFLVFRDIATATPCTDDPMRWASASKDALSATGEARSVVVAEATF